MRNCWAHDVMELNVWASSLSNFNLKSTRFSRTACETCTTISGSRFEGWTTPAQTQICSRDLFSKNKSVLTYYFILKVRPNHSYHVLEDKMLENIGVLCSGGTLWLRRSLLSYMRKSVLRKMYSQLMHGAIGKLLVGWGSEGDLQTSLYFSLPSSMPCEML